MNKAGAVSNIALIGFMGAGKTTCGFSVAHELGYEQVDSDRIIEHRSNCRISDIFAKHGEQHFRSLETQIMRELAARQNVVISTGGGVVKNPVNIEILAKSCFIVYLETDSEDILSKLSNDKSRPLLNTGDKKQTIAALLAERAPLYKKYCDARVSVKGRSINDIRCDIVTAYHKHRQEGN